VEKLTKIVATIGPASDSEEKIEELIRAGVNVFRFNFKHSSVEWHSQRIERVQKVAEKLGANIATLIDLQGPSIRTNQENDELECSRGEKLVFGEDVFSKHEKGISLSHPEVIEQLEDGQKLLVNDGLYSFRVKRESKKTYVIAEQDAVLKNKRNVSIPGSTFTFPLLIERDFEGLQLAARTNIDFVALSFVRTGDDIKTLREEMKKYKLNAQIVAKIETQVALTNLDEIIEQTDCVMVARGDMGVELPFEQVPYYQKLMIKKCIEHGKPVITATQLLQSMIDSPLPTRAEVSDVANAIYDFTDAIMLSGETASGSFPVESVHVMSKTASYVEGKPMLLDARNHFTYETEDQEQVIADAAYTLFLKAKQQKKPIKGFIVFTLSGRTARLISRYRPEGPIFAFAPSQHVVNTLALSFGVEAFIQTDFEEKKEITRAEIEQALTQLREKKLVSKGDRFILLHGDYWMVEGGTSTIKIITL